MGKIFPLSLLARFREPLIQEFKSRYLQPKLDFSESVNCYYVASWLNPLETMRFRSGPLDIRNWLIKQWFVAHSDKAGSCTCNIIFLIVPTFP